MQNPTNAAVDAIIVAASQISELVKPPAEVHDGCACMGKRFKTDPVCACAMKDYFRDGDDWYRVEVRIVKAGDA